MSKSKNLQSLKTKIVKERFKVNITNQKDKERLLKMYEHVGKAYSDWSERVTNGGLRHHKIITTTTENKD